MKQDELKVILNKHANGCVMKKMGNVPTCALPTCAMPT